MFGKKKTFVKIVRKKGGHNIFGQKMLSQKFVAYKKIWITVFFQDKKIVR